MAAATKPDSVSNDAWEHCRSLTRAGVMEACQDGHATIEEGLAILATKLARDEAFTAEHTEWKQGKKVHSMLQFGGGGAENWRKKLATIATMVDGVETVRPGSNAEKLLKVIADHPPVDPDTIDD